MTCNTKALRNANNCKNSVNCTENSASKENNVNVANVNHKLKCVKKFDEIIKKNIRKNYNESTNIVNKKYFNNVKVDNENNFRKEYVQCTLDYSNKKPNSSASCKTNDLNYSINNNLYVHDLLTYSRLNYKNVSDKIYDKDYNKYNNPVLWYLNDNLIQIGTKRSSFAENGNYKLKIPISSSFRPLDIAKISSYLYSHNKFNYRFGQTSKTDFKLYTSISRPLKIRQF